MVPCPPQFWQEISLPEGCFTDPLPPQIVQVCFVVIKFLHPATAPIDTTALWSLLFGRMALRQNLGFSQEPIKHFGVAFSTLPNFKIALPNPLLKRWSRVHFVDYRAVS
jgi:hypothetical protein